MARHLEPTGNAHWWPRTERARKNVLKVLKGINRVITPAMVNAALPPLPPKLWNKMRRVRPDLYKGEAEFPTVRLQRITKREWAEFAAACKRWKVPRTDVLIALVILFTKVAAGDDTEG